MNGATRQLSETIGTRSADRTRHRDTAFVAVCALLFAASGGATILWCGSMSGDMPMPGGWTMSMAWMRMPGQSWLDAAMSFMGMWMLMMVAMMLPSLTSMLSQYRSAVRPGNVSRLGTKTALVGTAYFVVWAAFGALVYPLGVAAALAAMRSEHLARLVPLATGVVVLLAGCVQLTAWKRGHLECCRTTPVVDRGAWRHGLRLGRHCAACCAPYIVSLLVGGVMDLGVMAIVTAAITSERLVPRADLAAQAAGLAVVGIGVVIIVRALLPA